MNRAASVVLDRSSALKLKARLPRIDFPAWMAAFKGADAMAPDAQTKTDIATCTMGIGYLNLKWNKLMALANQPPLLRGDSVVVHKMPKKKKKKKSHRE
jgi:hypothetical protein